MFEEYRKRIGHFVSCEVSGLSAKDIRRPGQLWWFCDRGPKAKILSSEEVAIAIENVRASSVREWVIVIGGPDGYTPGDFERFAPERRWSFGTMTLPHELASIVAAEQIYRGLAILANHPYHSGH